MIDLEKIVPSIMVGVLVVLIIFFICLVCTAITLVVLNLKLWCLMIGLVAIICYFIGILTIKYFPGVLQ